MAHRPGDPDFARLVRAKLAPRLEGTVETDAVHRTLYATDASIYRIEPLGVVFPRNETDVLAALDFAKETGVPVLPRGAGSSLAGQAVGEALILDFSRHMDRVRSIDAERERARVEPGAILARLNAQAAPYGLAFGPDPASANRATLGGMIANNATGTHSIVYRMTVDHLEAVRVLRADGEIDELSRDTPPPPASPWARVLDLARENAEVIRAGFPRIWRRVSGYDLLRVLEADHPLPILAGSEGTLGILLEATVRLVRPPARKALGVVPFESLEAACAAVPAILETKPSAVELLDSNLIRLARASPAYRALADFVSGEPAGVLVVEYAGEGDAEVSAGLARLAAVRLAAAAGPVGEIRDAAGQARVWAMRKVSLDLLLSRRDPKKPLAFVEDVTVPVERLAEFIVAFDEIVARNGTRAFHYGHASAGCLHCRPLVDIFDEADVERMVSIQGEVMDLVKSLGGSPSGEHGDGISLSAHLARFFGREVAALFEETKRILDPDRRLNPGKIVDPIPPASVLRSRGARAIDFPTRLDFSADGGILAGLRMCNGAGTCRKFEGTMCPSFPVMRDERHATRGRANLFVAFLEGRLDDEEGLAEALSLCLACRACRHECPSRVDVAKAKAEFLYRRRDRRGLLARVIDWGFARPELLLRLRRALDPLGPHRPLTRADLDAFARYGAKGSGPAFVLFADTFAREEDAGPFLAGVAALRRAGAEVVPVATGCCGRPAFSRGDLDLAARRGGDLVARLFPHAEAGRKIVVVEPSCLSMLAEDLPDLLATDAARAVAASVVPLARAVASVEPAPAARRGRVVYHPHCHEKSMGLAAEWPAVLERVGLAVETIDAGCCGMAGSFGYEHPVVSKRIALDRFLPSLADAAARGAVVAASGTSCRAQAARFLGLRPAHPAELL